MPAANAVPAEAGSTVMITSPAAGGPSFTTSPCSGARNGFMDDPSQQDDVEQSEELAVSVGRAVNLL
ncbi:MAG: hypothetical protein A2Z92_03665 [Omnitrophica WOR_2 bacterium GWA2_63_20]|nr:MAG: hypothetical protein A2Z92_03665 [Omnitrophica WOR_2 bacterium GWA2_63_20]